MENDYQENLVEKVERDKEKQRRQREIRRTIMTGGKFKKSLKGTNYLGGGLGVKLLKGKSGWKKFLIVTAAIIVSFFGGLSILAKCFREEKFFTLKVIVFWIIVLIFLIAFIAMLFVLSTCESLPGFVNWLANKISGFDICPP